MTEIAIRPARPDEASIVADQRRAMFVDMGDTGDAVLDRMTAEFIPWVARKMAAGEYLGWFAETADGQVVAGAGLWLIEWPPHFTGTQARRGYVLNVYVQPAYRRRGLARRLMEAILAACRDAGLAVVTLHASRAGAPMYETLGFRDTNEMSLRLDRPAANP